MDLLANFQTALGSDILGVTIMRLRGEITIASTTTAVAGVRIMTQSEFATLATKDGPISAPYADWMMYQPILANMRTGDATWQGRTIDVKASRKLEEMGQGLLLAFEDIGGGTGTIAAYDLSIGLKLP